MYSTNETCFLQAVLCSKWQNRIQIVFRGFRAAGLRSLKKFKELKNFQRARWFCERE